MVRQDIAAKILALWERLPVVVQAVATGTLIAVAGILPWSLMVSANLKVDPSFPWAFLSELLYLYLFWKYLRGAWWPRSNSQSRFERLRSKAVPPRLLPWAIVAGTLYTCALLGFQMIVLVFVIHPRSPLQEFSTVRSYPLRTALPLVLLGAVVAGVVEEAAFRGYMQVPIEKRHGPAKAIMIVAVLFTIAHFPSPAVIPLFCVAATGWGILAYLTGSIRPGIVFHSFTDGALWLWASVDPKSLEKLLTVNMQEGGGRTTPLVMLAVTGLSCAGLIAVFWKMASIRRMVSPGSAAVPDGTRVEIRH